MFCKEKIQHLKRIIEGQLNPLVDSNYWLLEVPHYDNIGDTLIWQGEIDFLRHFPFKCQGMIALDSRKTVNIQEKELVLFQGGGNFGDLWPKHHDYKMKIIAEHPRNKFLFFPQTVYFEHQENLQKCASFLSHYNVTICARDKNSYDILKKNFINETLLVPDMAFYMDISKWNNRTYFPKQPLLLKRADKEFNDSKMLHEVMQTSTKEVSDWITMVNKGSIDRWISRIKRRPHKLGWLYDPYMYFFYRPYLIRSGIKQLKEHTDIYTTRLHGCILSILLNKEKIVLFDNSYGKNSNFYKTWLLDCDAVKLEE